MTSRLYKSAQGKTIDLGQIILNNEHVRAVGNMNVNARGDRLDSANNVIDPKNKQVQRQHQRQVSTNVSTQPVHASSVSAKQGRSTPVVEDPAPVVEAPVVEAPVAPLVAETQPRKGGLAGAIAKSRSVVQEKEKTMKELTQFKPGVRKI
jgi:hypothetical protein